MKEGIDVCQEGKEGRKEKIYRKEEKRKEGKVNVKKEGRNEGRRE